MYGFPGTGSGEEVHGSGFPGTGSRNRGPMLYGYLATGKRQEGAGYGSRDTGNIKNIIIVECEVLSLEKKTLF